MVKQCQKHNLPEQIVCTGQMCNKRIGCQLCIDKHDHKFFLDTKFTQKRVELVREQLDSKLDHLKKYTKSNIHNLRLDLIKQRIQKYFDSEFLYIKNKIDEQLFNINLWMEKITKMIISSLQQSKNQILGNWENYNATVSKFLDSVQEYEHLRTFFLNGDWSIHDHVDQSVEFLYSEEIFFRFNRNFDLLKATISHHRKQDKIVMDWFQQRRTEFVKLQICPHSRFEQMMKTYDQKPIITKYIEPKTKQTKDDQKSILELMKKDHTSKAVIIYPQTVYEPFQNIYKLIRYDNQIFVTSGSRAINLWSRTSMIPEKTYPLNFPSYGILSFVQFGKDEAEQLIYGKSNGEMGVIDMKKQKVSQMPAHESAIRDIIQLDSYHFLTASQDWKLKLWAMSTQKQKQNKKQFASERLVLNGHSGRVYTLCKFGPNVLAGGSDGTIKLWDIMRQSFDEMFVQEKQIYAITQLRPQLFVSGGQIKQLRVWDYRKTKAHICRYPIQHTCNSILKYDENTIIFNDKNIIKVVDIRNMKQPVERMANDSCFSHVVNSMTYLSDNQIGMGGSDNVVTVWKY